MTYAENVSPQVVIMTRQELAEREGAAYRRGVERGKFESSPSAAKIAKNCAHWIDGRCQRCGVQWQDAQVDAMFACPHFETRK